VRLPRVFDDRAVVERVGTVAAEAEVDARRTICLVDLTRLGDTRLPDSDGTTHRLGDEWRDGTTVLVFLRHFG
jgi:hypothetical protein